MKISAKRTHIIKRIMATTGSILIIAALATILSPFWIKYWSEINPFTTVEHKPQLPTMSNPSPHKDEIYPEKLLPDGGYLQIPRLGLNLNIVYGVGEEDLQQAPGFYPQSGYPDNGNVCIAGHRNTAGSPFMDLDKMVKGDSIILTYKQMTYTYEVDSVFIVAETDWSVIDPTPKPALTLTTCDPPIRPADGKYNRLIVRSYLVSKSPIIVQQTG